MGKSTKKFTRSKSKYESEGAALQNLCDSQKLDASKLTAKHTETTFVWELQPEAATTSTETKTFTVEKTDKLTLQDAKRSAMDHFKTFEGNIKIVEQDETHIVFEKVR